jgi:hypothetical protein
MSALKASLDAVRERTGDDDGQAKPKRKPAAAKPKSDGRAKPKAKS